MQLLAQGIVGMADIFIHPQYTASGMWLGEAEGLVFFILMGLLWLSFWYLMKYLIRVDEEKKMKKRAMEKWLEPIPPPKGRT